MDFVVMYEHRNVGYNMILSSKMVLA